jgi:hypothetical protein
VDAASSFPSRGRARSVADCSESNAARAPTVNSGWRDSTVFRSRRALCPQLSSAAKWTKRIHSYHLGGNGGADLIRRAAGRRRRSDRSGRRPSSFQDAGASGACGTKDGGAAGAEITCGSCRFQTTAGGSVGSEAKGLLPADDHHPERVPNRRRAADCLFRDKTLTRRGRNQPTCGSRINNSMVGLGKSPGT